MPIPGPKFTKAEIAVLRAHVKMRDPNEKQATVAKNLPNPLLESGPVRSLGGLTAAIQRHTSHRGSVIRPRRYKSKKKARRAKPRAVATAERITGQRSVFLGKNQVIRTQCPKCSHTFD